MMDGSKLKHNLVLNTPLNPMDRIPMARTPMVGRGCITKGTTCPNAAWDMAAATASSLAATAVALDPATNSEMKDHASSVIVVDSHMVANHLDLGSKA